MPTKKTKAVKKSFVFIVDSYGERLNDQLGELGLKEGHHFQIEGAGGSERIMDEPSWLKAEKLLVFMSSFHGSVDPAVGLARRIKSANPNARIIFRSNSERSDDPVFEKSIKKEFGIDTVLLGIVSEFIS